MCLDPAGGAGHGEPEALPWRVGGQRVGQYRPAAHPYQQPERVLDADAVTEHALIAQVAVLVLGLQVHLAQRIVPGQVQGEGIVHGGVAAMRTGVEARLSPLLRVGAAVERQVTTRRHRLRRARQPEVDQVEVVRCQVHEQPAAVALVTVPATEVVGTVPGVEQPLEVHGGDSAHGPVGDGPAHRGGKRRVAVVVGDPQRTSGPSDRVQDGLQPVLVDGQRLFADDVAPAVERADDVAVMGAVDRADDHRVGTLLGEHRLEAVRPVQRRLAASGLASHHPVGVLHPGAVEITERHHLRAIGEVTRQRFVEEAAPPACPDQGISPLRVVHRRCTVAGRGRSRRRSGPLDLS